MTTLKSFRLDSDLLDSLEKEGKLQNRSLTNYITFLLLTHQDRGGLKNISITNKLRAGVKIIKNKKAKNGI